jgi:hypothetical protein
MGPTVSYVSASLDADTRVRAIEPTSARGRVGVKIGEDDVLTVWGSPSEWSAFHARLGDVLRDVGVDVDGERG